MTLSPVFRSSSAVHLLREEGIWERLAPAIESQARAVRTLHRDLSEILDPAFLSESPALPEPGSEGDVSTLPFLQEYFFLVLFRSLFESLGIPAERLQRYAEINFCVKGTITAADNLFDEQAKSLLPLEAGRGSRFLSILQLMCFERLIRRTLERGVEAGEMSAAQRDRILRGLLDLMARIGRLEGSEEGGVDDVPSPEAMIERVHRVRGGALFALAFVAPSALEEGRVRRRVTAAEPAVARLGTAFQIVDDLTDFEFDLGRRSHNLLVAQVHHHGSAKERALLEELREGGGAAAGMATFGGDGAAGSAGASGEGTAVAAGEGTAVAAGLRPPSAPGALVEEVFHRSAAAVLERAYEEARASFRSLAELGFWFPERLADEVVHAIVGLDGVRRMERLAARAGEG